HSLAGGGGPTTTAFQVDAGTADGIMVGCRVTSALNPVVVSGGFHQFIGCHFTGGNEAAAVGLRSAQVLKVQGSFNQFTNICFAACDITPTSRKYSENAGVFSGTTGGTVTHNLMTTPDVVQLTGSANGQDPFPSAIGAATFAINFAGGGSQTIYWTARAV